ncbi:Leucine-rich repeat receptor-like protein kinase PXC2 [Hibiscus syriacus]|uniref:Leucine-rich repeat receptor-like protein kinase PXC2 n=1 Tax=Hibiscus syriacus TaxID=106335 RepID=A0A6A2WTR0_HIBSY|nr:Leucine-rich repeat receptor-like protein kinase PXC2 [Hibiscus syriacus]
MLLNVLVFLVLGSVAVKSQQPSFNDDVLGLIFFKAGLQDPNAKLQSWSEDDNDPCNWVGVKCDPITYRVNELHLDGLSLSGHVGRGLLRLQFLKVLSLSNNNLTGTVISELSRIGSLQVLDLSGNALYGTIPDEFFSQCGSLKSVSFARNNLSGQIPDSLSSCWGLEEFNLSYNQIKGQLPSGIWFLRSLQSIDVYDSLGGFHRILGAGQVPAWIGELVALESLDLSANRFYGRIPFSLGNLQSLKELNLSMNRFIGKVPSWMFSVPFAQVLQVLDLSSNGLYGEIPSKLGVLSSLVFFNVSRNWLFGSVPTAIGELKAIQVVDLSDNMLNGSIPSEIGGAVSLEVLMLQRNFLSGKIPTGIVNCSSLTTLSLSENNLSGSIPTGFPNLSNLEYVDLSSNDLTGSLPKELANLSQLMFFNISHNHLHAVHPKPIVLNPNSSDSINSSSRNHHRKKIVLSISTLIAIGAAAFIIIGVIAITLLNIHVRSMSHAAASLMLSGAEDFGCSPTNDPKYGKLVMFAGDADFVAGASALLNKDCELGHGGFGVVYRTILRDGRAVAIKKLTVSSLIKSQLEFERELRTLGKIRHHNLVALEGYYWTPSLQLLIYEFVPSGNLYQHIHDGPDGSSLSWQQRFNIILGMAKGLAYLHQMNIIHYNLKSTNVLIDSSGEAKVGDYSLARLLPTVDRCVLSSKIQSALGYMAPEFACKTVKITEKCDVYGFGVLVLEVITGKRPVEYMEDDVVVLTDMVRGALGNGRVKECVDGRLWNNFLAEEAIPVIKLGLICASQVPSNRPDMDEVVNILKLIQCPSDGNGNGKEEVVD